jgi:16S rRNA (cytosine1402-N4)-methyltransferase
MHACISASSGSVICRLPAAHKPVLLNEIVEALDPHDGGVYVDGTFGAGGYSHAILEAADCTVWAIDRDPSAIAAGAAMAEEFGGRLKLITGCFGQMHSLLGERDVAEVDGITLDLGVSSMQLDQPERGFSFRYNGPLDMRMEGANGDGPSAADVVNTTREKELADIIYQYGDERRSRQVAKAIVEARRESPITLTCQLAAIIRNVVGRSRDGLNPATRTFQALRIHVNDEIGELSRGLLAAETILSLGGVLTIVSFHSLEDRLVKDFLKQRSGSASRPSRHRPDTADSRPAPSFTVPSKGVIQPGKAETKANPRARSGRMRAAIRTAEPAWNTDPGSNSETPNS